MSQSDPRLHILLPVHNRRPTTVRFLEQLARQTVPDFHLLLIDDGSVDGTAAAARSVCPKVEILTGPGHWWWAGCLQHGAERLKQNGIAGGDVLLLINDDVTIAADFLELALGELSAMADTLLLARQIDAATGREIDFGGGVHADVKHLRFAAAREEREINCLPTRGLFLRWRDFERTGGFRPERLPHYLSDYEFTLRAQRAGLQLRVARKAAVAVHLDRTGDSLATLFSQPRGSRFRLLFSRRYKDNPVTWTHFASLVAPAPRRPWLWFKIWANFASTVTRCALAPQRGPPRSGNESKLRKALRPVARMLPERVRRAVRLHRAWQWFRGDYPSWAAARAASGGYDQGAILEAVLAATLAVRAGQAAFERDSVLFAEPSFDEPLLGALEQVRKETGGRLSVLDFGGSLGSTYWRHRARLPASPALTWDIVEQPAFVAAGRRHLTGELPRFFPDVRTAEAAGPHDVLLCSCVLQYLEDPARTLADWLELRIPFLLLNNLPLHRDGPNRLRVQHVPPSIYTASYPVWFLNRADFLAGIEADYRIVQEFASEAVWPVDGQMFPSTGLLLQRKTVPGLRPPGRAA